MKNKKRILGAILALALVVAAIVVPFADEPAPATSTITVNSSLTKDAQYAAYRPMNVVVKGDVYEYTVRDEYRAVLQELTGATKDAEIIETISDYSEEEVREFADALYAKVKTWEPDAIATKGVFKDVPQGYYLIVETQNGPDPDVYSLVMLGTADKASVTVQTKEETTYFNKKIKEANDSTGYVSDWQDAADYDIGDDIPYKLTAVIANNYDAYNTYFLDFHDKECKGLTFKPESVVVKVDGNVITTGFTVDTKPADGDTFDVVFPELKNISAVKAGSVITVEYLSTLNEEAKIGPTGNPNEGRLEFENNPYNHQTGKTPWDKVIAFTYGTIVNKVDGYADPLEGAGFTLYKFDKALNDYREVSAQIPAKDLTTFLFKGLDAGLYKLVETTVPEGYNPADDIEFEISAEYETESEDPKIIKIEVPNNLAFTVEKDTDDNYTGNVVVTVENLWGQKLPETGGIGTTIFYVIGSIAVFAAVVLVITKKRMNNDAE